MVDTKFSFINQKTYSYKINGSEFIVYVFPLKEFSQIEEFIKKTELENEKANHVVWGYSIWDNNKFVYKYFESSEPKKTSGYKIDYFLKIKNLCNCLIIIARYKSGSNLGIGLLSRSYLNSCLLSWDIANIKEISFQYLYQLDFKLDKQKTIFNLLNKYNFKILKIDYKDNKNSLFFYGSKLNDNLSNEFKEVKFIKTFWQ